MSRTVTGNLIGVRQSVVDELLLLNEHQTPMISLLGFGEPVTQVEHVWFDDSMFPYESTLAAPVAAVDVVITVASVEPYRVGHIIKVNDEMMRVTLVDALNVQLGVDRGYANTVAAIHALNDVVEVIFVEGTEGADARAARYRPRTRVSNLTQIFDDTVSISGTASVVSQYGIDDLYEHEKQKKLLELALQLEKAVINGLRFEAGNVRQMRGIRSFINTNVTDLNNAAVTYEDINDVMQNIYEAGGFKTGGNWKVIVPARLKRVLSNLDLNAIRLERSENMRGQVVDFFVSDFGQAEIVLNNNLRTDELLVVDANRITIRPLTQRDFGHEYLGKRGDYYRGMLVGEYTLEFLQEAAHGRILNIG